MSDSSEHERHSVDTAVAELQLRQDIGQYFAGQEFHDRQIRSAANRIVLARPAPGNPGGYLLNLMGASAWEFPVRTAVRLETVVIGSTSTSASDQIYFRVDPMADPLVFSGGVPVTTFHVELIVPPSARLFLACTNTSATLSMIASGSQVFLS